MRDILIVKQGLWCYSFHTDLDTFHSFYEKIKTESCSYCHMNLDYIYSYIIGSLREAGLLSEKYIPACCYCQTLVKLGLTELINHCGGINYYQKDDILCLHFVIEGNNIYFSIHDASKVLED